jgi:UDP-hydrolysing UDP-N-acetyl-D-glucosamine 2-epimerase
MTVRVAVVTSGRADYGLLHPLLARLRTDTRFDMRIVATGSHLAAGQGFTVEEIENDGFAVFRRVQLPDEGDDRLAMAHVTGAAVSLLADAIQEAGPDVLVLLGDRFETFAAAAAAVVLGVPIAHIHGGELTLGSIDDAFRHAITKMSTLHFASTEVYRKRIIQMGEPDFAVFNVGALAVDNVLNTELMDENEVARVYGVRSGPDTLLTTFHPVTRGADSTQELRQVLRALDALPAFRVLFTAPNADSGGRALRRMLEDWVLSHQDRAELIPSLGWRGYLSAAHNAAAVVGNSSSGVIEVPALGVPSVDIGTRQAGRVRPAGVVHAEPDTESIIRSIERATSPEHRALAASATNPFGSGHAAERIADVLADVGLRERARSARFVDLTCEEPNDG